MRIAIIEDSASLVRIWKSYLDDTRFEAEIFSSAPVEIARLEAFGPALVVVNAVPSKSTAREIVDFIEKTAALSSARLVLATSFDVSNLEALVDPGAFDGMLFKPFTRESVVDLFERFRMDRLHEERGTPLAVVVDDSSTMRGLLSKEMRALGFDVATASNGREGLALIRERLPNVALIDMAMPEMNGTQLCSILAKDPETRGIPIVIVSSIIDEQLVREAFDAGTIDYVKKPFDSRRLAETVRYVMGREAQKPLERLHTVVLEKNPITSSILGRFFERRGLTAHIASTFEELGAFLKLVEPEIIVLNLDIDPKIVELCYALRGQKQLDTVPIVAITTGREQSVMLEVLRAGVNDYIKTPFANEELKIRITNLLRTRRLQADLVGKNRALENLAFNDVLTGLFNRAHFDQCLGAELSRAERSGEFLALVMIDFDHFKKVNDTFGHTIGDEVLKDVSGIIREGVRVYDTACRFGGEEVCVLMPGAAVPNAVAVAERLRHACEHAQVSSQSLRQTLSLGVAVFPTTSGKESLVRDADAALYAAKSGGRNRVVLFGTEA